ncbi:MAG: AAA family ATPase [Clostridia bacterium]|nr:AAA family ATPase [Clostridia bacterium]
MSSFFAVTSGKGGVGKSSFCVGLAFAFCEMDKKVLLIDMDEGFRCLDLMLGVDKEAVFDLSDVLMGKELEAAVYTYEKNDKLSLIPAPAKQGLIDHFALANFIKDIEDKFDIIIFDFPAGMDMPLYKALPEKTQFLTVAVPDPVSIRDASVIGSELYKSEINSRLIINRFVYKQSRKEKIKNIDSMIDTCSIRLIGIVPESEEISRLSLNHKLNKRSKATASFERIAKRLMGEKILLPKLKII